MGIVVQLSPIIVSSDQENMRKLHLILKRKLITDTLFPL